MNLHEDVGEAIDVMLRRPLPAKLATVPIVPLSPVGRRRDTGLAELGRKLGEHPARIPFESLESIHIIHVEASQPPLLLALGESFEHDFTRCFIRRGDASRRVQMPCKLRLDRGRDPEVDDLGLAFAIWFFDRLHHAAVKQSLSSYTTSKCRLCRSFLRTARGGCRVARQFDNLRQSHCEPNERHNKSPPRLLARALSLASKSNVRASVAALRFLL